MGGEEEVTDQKNPVILDAHQLILHAAQCDQTFEEYSDRVVKAARAALKKVSTSLVENEFGKGKRK